MNFIYPPQIAIYGKQNKGFRFLSKAIGGRGLGTACGVLFSSKTTADVGFSKVGVGFSKADVGFAVAFARFRQSWPAPSPMQKGQT